ncbi:MAG: hypothetical protein U0350_39440 [Caldilineaceae bacterium]
MIPNHNPIRPNDRKIRFTVAALALASSLTLFSAKLWPAAFLYLWFSAFGLIVVACLILLRFHGLSKRGWGLIVLLLLLPPIVLLVRRLMFG